MFIHVPLVNIVKMALVQIIDMTFMPDRSMTTIRSVRMGVLIVRLMLAHFILLDRAEG
jgi:hypothetical protein